MKKTLLLIFCLSLCSFSLFSQEKEQADSIVRLLSASRARIVEIDGKSFRKIEGDANFFHNNTYLICDTALWNVEEEYIDAEGHVQIVQDNTILTGDRLHYIINEDLAQFRGSLVQMTDKEGNTLRTNHLDYNTKDSIAVFNDGASMKDKDGNIIESNSGTYESSEKRFTFIDNVEMFSDSLFFVTTNLKYYSDRDAAYFGQKTMCWNDENFLSANAGMYDRNVEKLIFDQNVFIQTADQEAWCKMLIYERNTKNCEMMGNIQIYDKENDVVILGDNLTYVDSIKRVLVTIDPSFIAYTEEDNIRDTTYMAADTLLYYQLQMCDVDSALVAKAKARKDLTLLDPFETAKNSGKKENKPGPGGRANSEGQPLALANNSVVAPADSSLIAPADSSVVALADSTAVAPTDSSLIAPADSSVVALADSTAVAPADSSLIAPADSSVVALADSTAVAPVDSSLIAPADSSVVALADSTAVAPTDSSLIASADSSVVALADSTAVAPVDSSLIASADSLAALDSLANLPPLDTTEIGFLKAYHKVKVYKTDMQMLCDSLIYSDLDSIACLYSNPVLWNEITNQLTGDSIQFVVQDGELKKGYLLSNAFIAIKETEKYFHQVKSPEMTGFFTDGKLSRFDALGGFSAIFYLTEDTLYTSINQKEGKIMSARLEDGAIDRVYYLSNLKSDVHPLLRYPLEQQRLKDFNWRGDERPIDKYDITDRVVRDQIRDKVLGMPGFPIFEYTDIYFQSYIPDILAEINNRKPLKWKNRKEPGAETEEFYATLFSPLAQYREKRPVKDTIVPPVKDIVVEVKDSIPVSTSPVNDSLSVAVKDKDTALILKDSVVVVLEDTLKTIKDSSSVTITSKVDSSAKDTLIQEQKDERKELTWKEKRLERKKIRQEKRRLRKLERQKRKEERIRKKEKKKQEKERGEIEEALKAKINQVKSQQQNKEGND